MSWNKFSKQDFEKLLRLCAIKLEWEEKEKIYSQLDSILDFVSQLQEIDTEDTQPLYHPIEDKLLLPQKWIEEFEDKKDLLKNVKHPIKSNAIVIKRIVKK